jgi:hypothetical protein
MHAIKSLALAFAFCLPAAGSAAQQADAPDRWRPFYSDAIGRSDLDMQSLQRDGESFTIVNRVILNQAQGEVVKVHLLSRFHCGQRTFALLRVTEYRADDSVNDDIQVPAGRIRPGPVSPNSPGAAILNIICPAAAPAGS